MRRVAVQRGHLADGLLHQAWLRQRRLHRGLGVLRQPVLNGSQQQFVVRNSTLDGWSNGVWNQVFSGDNGAPAQNFGSGGQYTTLAPARSPRKSRSCRRTPAGTTACSCRRCGTTRSGPSWAGGRTPGPALPIQRFFIAAPGDPVLVINAALARGQDLILSPGVYDLPRASRSPGPTPWCSASASRPWSRRTASSPCRWPACRASKLSGHDRRRRAGELPRTAPGRHRPRRAGRPGRTHAGPGRVLPHRRRDAGRATHQPGRQQLAGDPGRHLGLAGRPRRGVGWTDNGAAPA